MPAQALTVPHRACFLLWKWGQPSVGTTQGDWEDGHRILCTPPGTQQKPIKGAPGKALSTTGDRSGTLLMDSLSRKPPGARAGHGECKRTLRETE